MQQFQEGTVTSEAIAFPNNNVARQAVEPTHPDTGTATVVPSAYIHGPSMTDLIHRGRNATLKNHLMAAKHPHEAHAYRNDDGNPNLNTSSIRGMSRGISRSK